MIRWLIRFSETQKILGDFSRLDKIVISFRGYTGTSRMASILFLILVFASEALWAHARLSANGNIPPRNINADIKTGPCGFNNPRTNSPKTFVAGSTVQVDWEETIQHPGRYEIYFSPAGDANFQLLKTVVDNQDNPLNVPHNFSTTITLPNVICTDCTIQLVQVMTENPALPTLYFSCGDIALVPNGTPLPPSPPPTPAPTPTPTPSPGPVHCP